MQDFKSIGKRVAKTIVFFAILIGILMGVSEKIDGIY